MNRCARLFAAYPRIEKRAKNCFALKIHTDVRRARSIPVRQAVHGVRQTANNNAACFGCIVQRTYIGRTRAWPIPIAERPTHVPRRYSSQPHAYITTIPRACHAKRPFPAPATRNHHETPGETPKCTSTMRLARTYSTIPDACHAKRQPWIQRHAGLTSPRVSAPATRNDHREIEQGTTGI